ncbi:MAG: helix-turn-helix domain-containing protein [Actinomycetota bacterium]
MSETVRDAGAKGGAKRPVGETRDRVREYARRGLNNSEIGRLLGISREAVRDHVKKLRAAGELPEEGAA